MSQDKKGKAKAVEEHHSADESDQTSANEEEHDSNFDNIVDKDGIPKSARSAFAFYQRDARAKILKENKNLSGAEVQALIKSNWAALKPADKEFYEKLHATDTIRYLKAMANLKNNHPELFETKKEAAKNSPKKPPAVSAYSLFTKEWNKKMADREDKLPFNEASKACSAAWKDLAESKKEVYVKAALAETERRKTMTPEEIEKERKAAASKKRKAESSADDEPAAKKAKTSDKKDDKKAGDKDKQKEKQKQKEKEQKEKEKEKKRKEEQKKKEQKKQPSSSSEESDSE